MSRSQRYQDLFDLPPDAQVRAFADMRGFYPTRVIPHGEVTRELPAGRRLDFHYEHDGNAWASPTSCGAAAAPAC